MQGKIVGIGIGLVLVSIGLAGVGPATAADSGAEPSNTPPLAEAGLDREVRAGATVWLDATGSRDPDGTIEDYAWSITAPNGTTFTPGCADCGRTEFVPAREGRYNVTVTVTDDDGATRSDTLYVDVNGTLPSASLSGPTEPTVDEDATYTVELEETRAVETVVWRSNRSLEREETVGRETVDASTDLTFDDAEPRRLRVLVRTAANQRTAAELVVRPQVPAPVGSDSATVDGTDENDGPRGFREFEWDGQEILIDAPQAVVPDATEGESGIGVDRPDNTPSGQELDRLAQAGPAERAQDFDRDYRGGGGGFEEDSDTTKSDSAEGGDGGTWTGQPNKPSIP